jgi:hypothetical protein
MNDRIDGQLRAAARDYNEPPETPREAMWERIVVERKSEKSEKAERTESGGTIPFRHLRFLRQLRPLTIGAGVAALLAIGIGLGRLTVRQSDPAGPPPDPASEAPSVNAAAYRLATTEHLSQAEAFLTLFRASVRRGGDERLATATARQLLATNRLLLDSPAARDARTRVLLQDLELVLAEIAQLSSQPRSGELDLITEGMEQGGVLSRLRTAVPAGTSATQGVL